MLEEDIRIRPIEHLQVHIADRQQAVSGIIEVREDVADCQRAGHQRSIALRTLEVRVRIILVHGRDADKVRGCRCGYQQAHTTAGSQAP